MNNNQKKILWTTLSLVMGLEIPEKEIIDETLLVREYEEILYDEFRKIVRDAFLNRFYYLSSSDEDTFDLIMESILDDLPSYEVFSQKIDTIVDVCINEIINELNCTINSSIQEFYHEYYDEDLDEEADDEDDYSDDLDIDAALERQEEDVERQLELADVIYYNPV